MLRSLAVCGLIGSASAFAPAAAPMAVRGVSQSSSPVMSAAEEGASRRAVLAAFVAAVPAAANAMTVPGLNAPGLVPAKKQERVAKPSFESIRDVDTNHFWSPKGIMDSVPKVKGIITPKTPVK